MLCRYTKNQKIMCVNFGKHCPQVIPLILSVIVFGKGGPLPSLLLYIQGGQYLREGTYSAINSVGKGKPIIQFLLGMI
jgi:hypothetical protein